MQRQDGAAVGRPGLGHVKAHAAGLDERSAHPVDRRWLGSHKSDYRERLPRYRAGMGGYRELFNASIADPTAFWADAARAVTWTREPQRVLDDSNPPFYRWFPDGELNTCANALDRHVDGGRAEQPALIYDSPVTGSQRTYTYRELLDETARFAGALRGLGVGKGDRVVIYMPMVPEAVIAMLACARLGAVHSVVFGGFAAHELAARIDDARPAVIVSASCGIEPTRTVDYKPMLDAALEIAEHAPPACVILQREQRPCEPLAGRDHDWRELMADAQPVDAVPVAATDPLYVLYTSGTTGKPKGIVRDNGGHAVALLWSMRNIYDTQPGEVYWAASDVGWVVGHSYIVYAPLLLGATTVLYEGKPVGTPDAGAFWRVASEHGVKALFTAPTAIRAIKKEDPEGTAPRQVRPVGAEVSVPGGRTPRPRHLRLGFGRARHPGRRPLVADRNGLGDRRQPDGRRTAADQARLRDGADARIRRADPAAGRLGVRPERGGRDLRAAAAAARHVADGVGRRRPLHFVVSVGVPGLLPHR